MHVLNLKILFFVILLFSEYLCQSDSLIISLNTKIKIDSIRIIGNEITEDFIILDELLFQESDTVTGREIDLSKERIYSLNIFGNVNLFVKKENDFNILIIEVKEVWYLFPLPFLNLRDQNLSKSSYGLRLIYKNFRGRNEFLSAMIAFGYDPSYSFTYFSPSFFRKDRLGIEFSFSSTNIANKDSEIVKALQNDFDYNYKQLRFRITKRIDLYNFFSFGSGFNYVESPYEGFNEITASGMKIDKSLSFSSGYIYDTRDLIQFPTEGLLLNFYFEHFGFNISDINYNIIHLDMRNYQKIDDNLFLKWRIKTRNSFGRVVPLYQQSYLGFDSYIRGHRNTERGGHNSLLASLEMVYEIINEWKVSMKLPYISEKLTTFRFAMHLGLFGDTGTTYDNNEKISTNEFNSGWGVGIIILVLPYNTLRFEYSFDEYRNGEFLIGSGVSF